MLPTHFKAIVIDDELNARLTLKALLEEYCPEIKLLADFERPQAALSYLLKNSVDVAFIDVNMPRMTGFELIESLQQPSLKIVIVSAYDHHGIQAVKAGAFDYVLKPIAINDLRQCIAKLQADQRRSSAIPPTENASFNLTIPLTNGIKVVDYRNIVSIASDNSYCDVVLTHQKKFVVTKSIGDFESQLTEKGFFRVHNTHLINTYHVDTIKLDGLGAVVMTDGREIPVSRRRMKDFKDEIQRRFGSYKEH